jgi:hypothetical protein
MSATKTDTTGPPTVKLFSDLFDFSSMNPQKRALAYILPILGVLAIVFLGLLIVLFLRKRHLKAKLNQTPGSAPADSDGEGSTGLASPDLIARPSSA